MRARALGLLASVLLVSSAARAQGGYPAWNGGAVQDDAGILTPAHEDSLRTLLAPARSRGVDVRVVTIRAMADYPVPAAGIEPFAHGLFDSWRVGDRPERDGVLLLVATDDRRLRIQLGDGVLHLEPDAQRVVDDSILPWFRQGMRPRGILRGTAGIAAWFAPGGAASRAPVAATPQPAYTPPPRAAQSPGAGGVVIVGVLLVGMFVGLFALSAWQRSRPRDCPQCGVKMARLDEAQDDVYLDSGQKMEEFLSSIDYDVWKCGACGTHTLLPYPRLFSSVSQCPSCRYRTVTTTRNVLEHATYDHGGREEVIRDCRNCGHHDSQVVHTPARPRPRPSDDDSSWSSSGSSSSFSFSSSSDSSSSGGGFSSGGGASGSW
ncbi:MAG: TPM domain-containing protein [Longimicrobiaceae bacterium]